MQIPVVPSLRPTVCVIIKERYPPPASPRNPGFDDVVPLRNIPMFTSAGELPAPPRRTHVAPRLRRTVPVLLTALVTAACGLLGGDGESDGGTPPDTAGAVSESTAPTASPQQTDTLAFLMVRLDSLLAGQRALDRRLDSLSAAAATEDTADATPDTADATADTDDASRPEAVLGEARRSVEGFAFATALSAIVIVLFNLLIRGTAWLLDTLAERNPRRRLFYKRLVPIIRIVLWIFAAYLIGRVIFRIDAQGLVAAAAAIGVAVGFAAQDLLKNLFGGLILIFDQPFQVGDKVTIGDTYGEVKSIGLRSTRIVTADDNLVSVPNAQVVDQQVANANAGELNCQVVTDLYLPGWADEETAKRIAFDAATSSKYIFLNKPIVVLISDIFKETFLTRVRVKAYVMDPRLERLFQSDVTERARAGFREAGLLRPEQMRPYLVEEALSRQSASDAGESP